MQTRLWLFRHRFLRAHHPACLVISIGNLTVGGTGKTPVVEKFARTLQDHGRRVAILSRGYKSKKPPLLRRLQRKWLGMERRKPRIVHDGQRLLLDSRFAGDEPFMLAKSLGDVIVLVDKDRVRAALYAIREMKCDTLILDDGMQYLHLKHRLEICLIDAQAPFGNEYLLPRGTLREPPSNLRRASYIFITKTPPAGNAALIERIREYNRTAEIVECRHQPLYLQNLYDSDDRKPLEHLRGKYIAALSGIARPESFEQSLVALGAQSRNHQELRGPSSIHGPRIAGVCRALLPARSRLHRHHGKRQRALSRRSSRGWKCRSITCAWKSKSSAGTKAGRASSTGFAARKNCSRRSGSLLKRVLFPLAVILSAYQESRRFIGGGRWLFDGVLRLRSIPPARPSTDLRLANVPREEIRRIQAEIDATFSTAESPGANSGYYPITSSITFPCTSVSRRSMPL